MIEFTHKAPDGYSYEFKEHKRGVIAIWLRNHATFSYTSDPVRTIWGFFDGKKGYYYAPINATKHGDKVDIADTRDFTAMQLNLNPLEAALYG